MQLTRILLAAVLAATASAAQIVTFGNEVFDARGTNVGFWPGDQVDVYREAGELTVANGRTDRSDRGSVTERLLIEFKGEIVFDEMVTLHLGQQHVEFLAPLRWRPNVGGQFANWWGVNEVSADDVPQDAWETIHDFCTLGPSPDTGDSGRAGSPRVVPRVAIMATCGYLRGGFTDGQLRECERWIKAQGLRGFHWYEPDGSSWFVDKPGSNSVAPYRAAPRHPDGTVSGCGKNWNAPDHAHLDTQLVEVAALTRSPRAMRYAVDLADVTHASAGAGVRMARSYGWRWLLYAKVAGAFRPWHRDVAERMDSYVVASLSAAEGAVKVVPAGSDPDVDPSFVIPVATPPRGDHVDVSDAMRQAAAIWSLVLPDEPVTDEHLEALCESVADWQCGIYVTGGAAALWMTHFDDEQDKARLSKLVTQAVDTLAACRRPMIDHQTMTRKTGGFTGWSNDVAGGTLPQLPGVGIALMREESPSHAPGTCARFTLPGVYEAARLPSIGHPVDEASLESILTGADDVVDDLAERRYYGAGQTYTTRMLGSWLLRTARRGWGE